MIKLNILMTGVTSFSGAHFAYELLMSGHSVVGFTRNAQAWGAQEKERVFWIKTKFPNFEMIALDSISKLMSKNFEVLCLHGAHVQNYQSSNFDINYAVNKTLEITNTLTRIFPKACIFQTCTFS